MAQLTGVNGVRGKTWRLTTGGRGGGGGASSPVGGTKGKEKEERGMPTNCEGWGSVLLPEGWR
jgi:hypothetical protein